MVTSTTLKRCIPLFALIFIKLTIYGQSKPALGEDAHKSWSYVSYSESSISDDGKYAWYQINNYPVGKTTVKVKAVESKWEFETTDFNSVKFITTSNGTLAVLYGGEQPVIKILKAGTSNIKEYKGSYPEVGYINKQGKEFPRWLAFNNDTGKSMQVLNLENDQLRNIGNLTRLKYLDIPNKILATFSTAGKKVVGVMDLQTGRVDTIAAIQSNGFMTTDAFCFGKDHKCFFKLRFKLGEKEVSEIYKYDDRNHSVAKVLSDQILQKEFPNLVISWGQIGVNPAGDHLYFNVDEIIKDEGEEYNNGLGIIWKYTDRVTVSNTRPGANAKNLLSTLDLKSGEIQVLESDNAMLTYGRPLSSIGGNTAIMAYYPGIRFHDDLYGIDDSIKIMAVSLSTAIPTELDVRFSEFLSLSPNGKYVASLSKKTNSFVIHDLENKTSRNLPFPVEYSKLEMDVQLQFLTRVAGWSADGDTVYFYSRFDIWMASTAGKFDPVNLTGGIGFEKQIQFRFLQDGIIDLSKQTVLAAFNMDNMNNGFYGFSNGIKSKPVELAMGPYFYYYPEAGSSLSLLSALDDGYSVPVKSKYANTFILTRSESSTSRNIFITKDFKSFVPLSDHHPESKYNWIKSELLSWKVKDGVYRQGILYKPGNFDSTKKYPVIFYVYDQLSMGLNASLKVEELNSSCNISIPQYVSNGYMVFCPDGLISYGQPFQSEVENIKCAIKALLQHNYIDPARLGIAGCSFGAMQVNYIITQVKNFAAACSASGIANMVSSAHDNDGETVSSNINYFAWGQVRMKKTFYEDKWGYINNSAIFYGDNIQTPLLLMHTDKDGRCKLYDIVQFYTALRSAGKKVWLLEYFNQDHGVAGPAGADFSHKMKEFFDHYLMGKEAPGWLRPSFPNNYYLRRNTGNK